MLGEKQIIDARKQGFRPSAIFFQAGFELPVFASRFENPENALATKQYPEVWITPQELSARLDLRFAVGCLVIAHGPEWSEDFLVFIERLAETKPFRIVVSSNENGDLMIWENGVWSAHADPA